MYNICDCDNFIIFAQAIFYKKYSIKSDVWSFGCVMYEIWSLGHKPFEEEDIRKVASFNVLSLVYMDT